MRIKFYLTLVLISSCSAILLAICFPPCHFSFLVWFALVPWLWLLTRVTFKQLLLAHFLFQLFFYGIGSYWLSAVHPLALFAVQIPLYFICLPFPLLFWWIAKKKIIPLWLATPILWSAQEYLRSFLFTGFPYAFLGHTVSFYPILIQLADITGVYGVTFVIVTVNSFLFICLQYLTTKKEDRQLIQIVGAFLFCLVSLSILISYGYYKLQTISYEEGPKVAALQGNIPQEIKGNPLDNKRYILESYGKLTVDALRENPALIIWPETMCPEDIQMSASMYAWFHDMAVQGKTAFLLGSHYYEFTPDKQNYKLYNSAFYMDEQGKIIGRYDKNRLVIAGEYIPLRKTFPFMPILIKNLVGYVPDIEQSNIKEKFSLQNHDFGCAICYDIAFPTEIREWRKKGCEFIVNLTNEGWFYNTSELEQLLAISMFRAVESRIGIIRATNTGITTYIPPTGIFNPEQTLTISMKNFPNILQPFIVKQIKDQHVIAWNHLPNILELKTEALKNWDCIINNQKLKWKDFPGILCHSVPLATKELSFYTKWGDVFSWIMFFLTFLFIGFNFIKPSKLNKS